MKGSVESRTVIAGNALIIRSTTFVELPNTGSEG